MRGTVQTWHLPVGGGKSAWGPLTDGALHTQPPGLVDRPTPCRSAHRKIWPLLHRVRAQTFHGSPHPHQETWDLLAEAHRGRFRHGHKPMTPYHRDERGQTLDFPPDARRSVGSVNRHFPGTAQELMTNAAICLGTRTFRWTQCA